MDVSILSQKEGPYTLLKIDFEVEFYTPTQLLNNKLLRYFFVGGLSTLIHITLAYLYLYFIDTNGLYGANTVGFSAGFTFSYFMQSLFVYKHSISYAKAIRYFIVQLASLIVSVSLSDYIFESGPYIKVLIVVIILPFITYTVHNLWTFRDFENRLDKK